MTIQFAFNIGLLLEGYHKCERESAIRGSVFVVILNDLLMNTLQSSKCLFRPASCS